MRDLQGRTAIVTGATGALGEPIARALVEAGMNVVLVARSADTLKSLAAKLNAVPFPADVTNGRAVERLIRSTLDRFGTIDLLVNNAGVETYYPFHLLDPAAIRRSFELNATAPAILARLALPHMLEQGSGHIVNISSTAGKHGPACGAAYGASKAALIAFTQALRMEYRPRGVSASVVCPGFVRGDGMYARMCADAGRKVPAIVGTASSKRVTRAVLEAVRRDLPEVIVNNPPLRPLFVLAAAFPRIGEWIATKSVRRFLMRVAEARVDGERAATDRPHESRKSA